MWPFSRKRKSASEDGPETADGAAPDVAPVVSEPAAWETLAPLSTTVGPPDSTFKIGAAVKDDLTALRPTRLSQGLGHAVSTGGPSGLVSGLVQPRSVRPVVQRQGLGALPPPSGAGGRVLQRSLEFGAGASSGSSPSSLDSAGPHGKVGSVDLPLAPTGVDLRGGDGLGGAGGTAAPAPPPLRSLVADQSFTPPASPVQAPDPEPLRLDLPVVSELASARADAPGASSAAGPAADGPSDTPPSDGGQGSVTGEVIQRSLLPDALPAPTAGAGAEMATAAGTGGSSTPGGGAKLPSLDLAPGAGNPGTSWTESSTQVSSEMAIFQRSRADRSHPGASVIQRSVEGSAAGVAASAPWGEGSAPAGTFGADVGSGIGTAGSGDAGSGDAGSGGSTPSGSTSGGGAGAAEVGGASGDGVDASAVSGSGGSDTSDGSGSSGGSGSAGSAETAVQRDASPGSADEVRPTLGRDGSSDLGGSSSSSMSDVAAALSSGGGASGDTMPLVQRSVGGADGGAGGASGAATSNAGPGSAGAAGSSKSGLVGTVGGAVGAGAGGPALGSRGVVQRALAAGGLPLTMGSAPGSVTPHAAVAGGSTSEAASVVQRTASGSGLPLTRSMSSPGVSGVVGAGEPTVAMGSAVASVGTGSDTSETAFGISGAGTMPLALTGSPLPSTTATGTNGSALGLSVQRSLSPTVAAGLGLGGAAATQNGTPSVQRFGLDDLRNQASSTVGGWRNQASGAAGNLRDQATGALGGLQDRASGASGALGGLTDQAAGWANGATDSLTSAVPSLPSLDLASLPSLPSAPSIPSLPSAPAIPAVPSVPAMPNLPTELTFPPPPGDAPVPSAAGGGDAPAGASAAAGASTGSGAGAVTGGELDELARKLYDRIRWRLRAELRLDMERAGLGAGVRR